MSRSWAHVIIEWFATTPLQAPLPCRGPLVVSCGHHSDDVFPDDHEDINSKLLYLEVCFAREGQRCHSAQRRSRGRFFCYFFCPACHPCPGQPTARLITSISFDKPLPPIHIHTLLLLQDAPFDFPVLMCNHAPDAATGTSANEEQRAAVQAGGLVEGHVVLWGNTAFESRSNENITAQQEEVRREVGGRGM